MVKREGLKIPSLSGFRGSNPLSCININKMQKKINKRDFFILYLILIIFFMLFFLILINVKSEGKFYDIDYLVNSQIYKIQSPLLIDISKAITNIFNPAMFVILSAIAIFILIIKSRQKESFYFAIILSLSIAIISISKYLIRRVRPENILVSENTYSFPSSHALMAVIFFGTLTFLIYRHLTSKRAKLILVSISTILVIIMSLTRIILSAHWFSDVLAGISLGIFLLDSYILLLIKEHLLPKR